MAESEEVMTEPVYKWEPVTDVYKEKGIQVEDIEAEVKQKLEELHQSKERNPSNERRAPLGIRIVTWYYFCRAGVCAFLVIVLLGFPESAPSIWISDNVSSFLRLPGSKSEQEARRQELQKMAREYAVPENAIHDVRSRFNPETLRNMVMAYLLFNLGVAAVVGFMWWNRSWRVRWFTMCYSGLLVAKALVNFIAGAASGVGSEIAPRQMPGLVMVLGFNGLIFLYLAFGYGVKEWFEPES